MKKKTLLLLSILLMILTLTGCGKKDSITSQKFEQEATDFGYTVMDAKDQFSDYDYVNSALIALKNDSYQIEFYELDTDAQASSMYSSNESTFDSMKGSQYKENSFSGKNYDTRTTTGNGQYMHMCRIDNTLLYMNIPEENKESAEKLLDEIGY